MLAELVMHQVNAMTGMASVWQSQAQRRWKWMKILKKLERCKRSGKMNTEAQ